MTQRFTNDDLPSYKYIPKQGPHPSQIKDAVHIPEIEEGLEAFSERNWCNSRRYLYAIDLFNLGYYWEVHEVLEKIWMNLGKKSEEGFFIQGLIQLAVAMLKHLQGNKMGVKRLINKSLPKIRSQKGIYLGIDIDKLADSFLEYLAGKTDTAPQIVLTIC
jgi:predicted metal-dependent hydrolase